ncbi:MAG TPA: NAD-dependent epimerase/dehydratase family protein, partial [Rhizomicrobium sp.]|nr:NAD-dependent epimerase/dehydratase family protein [Rhizomicrobium sp.]
MSSPLRAGLIGAGYISEYHADTLRRLPLAGQVQVELAGICDLNRERAATIAQRFQIPGIYTSLAEMAAATHLDVVHVLTPPASHAAVTIEALKLGLDVFVEKPLATTVEDCDRIAEAARAAGKTVGVNHSLLRDPFVMRALEIARSGALGDILTVDYFRSSDYPPWPGGPVPPQYRDGGYPFRDLGVHALYVISAFLGEIQDVGASFRTKGATDPNILYDEWRASVLCAKGTGQFQLSWNVKPLQSNLIVQGTRGVLRADLFSMAITTRRSTPMPKAIERAWHPLADSLSTAVQVPTNVLRFLTKKILPYQGLRTMIADYYAALAAGGAPPVTVEDARPIVDWTERVARIADERKCALLASFPQTLTAKTLVTGSSGFLGRRLLARLLDRLPPGEKLRIMVRRDPPAHIKNDPRLEIVFGDMGDAGAMDRAVAGVETIYHAGGAMSGSPADFERGTVVAVRNLLASMERHGSPKLVYISSLILLHWAAARADRPAREDFPLEPNPEMRGAYTQGKLEAERAVLRAVQEQGARAVILRPGQIFGPGAPLITGAVARRAGQRLVILGNGRLVLPLVYVDDVIDAILLAAERDVWKGEIFHLVDSATLTQEQFARRVEPHAKIVRVPRFLVNLLAFGVEMLGAVLHRPVPLSRYRVASALAPIRFDCTAARERLGWAPR